ncbi:MAG: type 2 lanthipeptide synthetase LanM family protein [Chloroflexota bacterium]
MEWKLRRTWLSNIGGCGRRPRSQSGEELATISPLELREIVARATPLFERLSQGLVPDNSSAGRALVHQRLEEWQRTVARNDPARFARRLAWDNLDAERASRALGIVRLPEGQPLPAWAGTLAAALAEGQLMDREGTERDRSLDNQQPTPFEDILVPFIRLARQRLAARAERYYEVAAAAVHTSLEQALLRRLAGLCAQCLHLEFTIYRATRSSSLNRLLGQIQGQAPAELYRAFAQQMLAGGLAAFFQEYPVLARLVATVTDGWVEATADFLQRAWADRRRLQAIFGEHEELGTIAAVEPTLSDPHQGGRSVIFVTWSSGLKLVYKPRDMGLTAAYFDLVAWFNQQGELPPARVLKVLNQSTHGWLEWVERRPCQTEVEVKRFYWRAGMLLGLLYVLGGNDCHFENLIACGEYPVLVDVETLMHPPGHDLYDQREVLNARSLSHQQLSESVLRTGLLPRWQLAAGTRIAYDISGLGGDGEQAPPYRSPVWRAINTDQVALSYDFVPMRPRANLPTLRGKPVPVTAFANQVVEGFEQMIRFLIARRDTLTGPDSPLAALAHQRLRFVLRDTYVYGALLDKLLQPEYLRDGVTRSIELDVLCRPFLDADTRPALWPLVEQERQALEQVDIPYFGVAADSDTLALGRHGTLAHSLTTSTYAEALRYLNNLDETDLARQKAIIRSALYAQTTGRAGSKPPAVDLPLGAVTPLTPAELVQEALAIARDLQERAIRAADGSATWIGLEYLVDVSRFQLQPLGNSLYDGVGGVALFLAAVEKVAPGAGFGSLALAALQLWRETFLDVEPAARPTLVHQWGIGGATGLGSIIYVLARVGTFLNEPALLEDARRLAEWLTPEAINADELFDVLSGAAGAILGLLTLWGALKDKPDSDSQPALASILEQAVQCGRHLLHHQQASAAGGRAWRLSTGQLLTGFSHGAAGIAYALLRLYGVTGEVFFLEAAQEAMAYERAVFVPTAGNWPDFRPAASQGGRVTFMTSWCNGAPGIGLARLGGLAVLDTEPIRQEISAALNTIQSYGLQDVDHVCCGNAGRTETLVVAAGYLKRPELLELARRQVAWIVHRARQRGAFFLVADLPADVYVPGFFSGTAGIGYQFLRAAYPDLFPSVLLWQ